MTQIFLFDAVGAPPSPGEIIRRKLLDDMDLTQSELARAIGISRPRLNMLLSGRCPLSPEIALRIERVFGISPQFWLRARADYELFQARRRLIAELESLPQLNAQDELRSSNWSLGDWQVAC
jgi:addiction module HigA family antidote